MGICDFHSPVLCVLSQTRRLFQSLIIRFIGVAGEIDCTNTDTANSSVHPWIPRTDRACTSASGKYSVKNRPCFATLTLLGIVADLVSQFLKYCKGTIQFFNQLLISFLMFFTSWTVLPIFHCRTMSVAMKNLIWISSCSSKSNSSWNFSCSSARSFASADSWLTCTGGKDFKSATKSRQESKAEIGSSSVLVAAACNTTTTAVP